MVMTMIMMLAMVVMVLAIVVMVLAMVVMVLAMMIMVLAVHCHWRSPRSFLGSWQLAAPGWLPNRGRHLVEKQVCFKISRLEIALQGPMMGRMKTTVKVDGNEVLMSFTGSLLP